MDTVHSQVLSPLNALLSLFQGPQRLIQKRNDKCLDYDSWSNKIDKIKDRDKLKTAKEELEIAKKNYEALNTQLLEEIPGFTEKCMTLVVDCMKNFALAHNNFYHQIRQEYEQLLQVLK
ncbi:PREDICTED: dynamin-binding protein-like [Acropora digitifera]|uniref:dynamin-binding protein-like n=1 Tax=Acropora digitifera TaxID=70779 RepID=UPI00077AE30C|nr:PREDICTED: dynamin-binding protein-like [Acropora digitifera]